MLLISEEGTPRSRAYMCSTSRPVSAPGSALNCTRHFHEQTFIANVTILTSQLRYWALIKRGSHQLGKQCQHGNPDTSCQGGDVT